MMKKEINLKLKKKHLIIFGGVLLAILGFYFFQVNLSGNVILELDADYSEGENLDGILKLSLSNGEFIPASSIVIFETSDQRHEFILEDILSEQPVEGIYYIQGQNLSGQGAGYGLMGIKKVYPEVSFEFNIYSKSKEIEKNKSEEATEKEPIGEEVIEVINETGEQIMDELTNETGEQVEEVTETIEVVEEVGETGVINDEEINAPLESDEVEKIKKQGQTEVAKEEVAEVAEVAKEEVAEVAKEEVKESKKESKEVAEKESVITGGVISSLYRNFVSLLRFTPTGQVSLSLETVVSGKTSANEPFVYNLEKGQTAELVSGSVTDGSMALSDGDIQFEVSEDSILVSTDYFKSEEGFGVNYLEDEIQIFEINLSAIGLNLSKGDLNISFVYEDEEVISLSTVLQEGKIKEGNESVLVKVPEFSLQNLTDDERQILIQKFGDVSVKTTVSEVLNGRLIRNYKIGDYELVASYNYDSGAVDSLEPQMERDMLNFLRDLIRMISEEENSSENVAKFFGSSDF